MNLRQSERKNAKIKMALQAPSGAGKTYSSLLLAKGLTNDNLSKVAVIDTENGSSDLYAHLGNYNVLSMTPPFNPEKYIEAIDMCLKAGMEVIIIDSISHCWDYLLEYHSSMPGNSFTNWGKITPMQNNFINKILQSDAHFIATIRTKQDYVLSNKNGKMVPEKVGLKGIQRDGVDYEFTLVFDININHQAVCSKDRTGMFADKPEFVITSGVGRKIKDWCNSGTDLEEIKEKIKTCDSLEKLRALYTTHITYKDLLVNEFQKQQEILKNPQNLSNLIKYNQNGTTSS
jgi:hypothetical protein